MKAYGSIAVGGDPGAHVPLTTAPYGVEYERMVARNVAANEGVRRLKRAVTDAIEGKGTRAKDARPKPARRDPKIAPRGEAVARESRRGGTPLHIRQAAIARYNAGEHFSVIAKDLGKNPRTIREWIYKSGDYKGRNSQGLITDPGVIRAMCDLYASGASTRIVAETYGISRTAAETALMRGGIKFRTRGETLSLMARNAKAGAA